VPLDGLLQSLASAFFLDSRRIVLRDSHRTKVPAGKWKGTGANRNEAPPLRARGRQDYGSAPQKLI